MEIQTNDKNGEKSPKRRSFINAFNSEVEKFAGLKTGQISTELPKEILIQYAVNTLKKPPQNRTNADLIVLQRCTKDIKFFKDYIDKNESHIHLNCLKAMTHLHLQAEETVFEIDTIGTAFYLILRGSVRVLIRVEKEAPPNQIPEETRDTKDPPPLPNMSFLPPKSNKSKSGKKTTIVVEDPSQLRPKVRHCTTTTVRGTSVFSMSPILSASFMAKPSLKFNESEEAQNNQSNENPKEELTQVSVLAAGASFGELALLSHKPRAATIICREDCDFAVLEQEEFTNILQSAEERKLLEEMNFFASLNMFKNWNFNLVKMLYVNTQMRVCSLRDIVYEEGEDADEMFIVQRGVFVVKKSLTLRNMYNLKKYGAVKDLFSNETKYTNTEMIKLAVLNLNESFGEEDLILNRKRGYTVECQTAEGQLRIIGRKNFFGRVMRDEGTAKLLNEKVKRKEEWYTSKFKEIRALKEGVVQTTEVKRVSALKSEKDTLPRTISLPQFLTLKRSLMKTEKKDHSLEENKIIEMTHSFIFKNIKNLEEKRRKLKNIQQLRINQFLTRVPKPKQTLNISFSNDFVKRLYLKTESEIAFKQSFSDQKSPLKISLSPSVPKIVRTDSLGQEPTKLGKNVSKIQKQLFERVNPSKSIEKRAINLNYSEIQRRFLGDSIQNETATVADIERKRPNLKITTESMNTFENDDGEKKKVDFSRDSKQATRRYILTSPTNFRAKQNLDSLGGRERELIKIQLKKNNSNSKMNKLSRLI